MIDEKMPSKSTSPVYSKCFSPLIGSTFIERNIFQGA